MKKAFFRKFLLPSTVDSVFPLTTNKSTPKENIIKWLLVYYSKESAPYYKKQQFSKIKQ